MKTHSYGKIGTTHAGGSSADATPLQGRYKRNGLIALAVFIGACGLTWIPSSFDIPVERAINSYANRNPVVDGFFFDLDTYYTFSGVWLVGLVWSCWFAADEERRGRVLAGALASLAAGIISRTLQHGLPSHPRPFYDPALGFHVLSIVGLTPFNTWHSFPSDHAAVFFGLATMVILVRPRLGLCVFPLVAVVEAARAYMGAHYPSDLIGGAALGCGLVWSAQARWLAERGRRVAAWARSSPSAFYFCAFFVSYQFATLFQEIRSSMGGVALLHELRRLFS
jgi:undecaprenyl-diphosphatase